MKYFIFSLLFVLSACDNNVNLNLSSDSSSVYYNYSNSNQVEVKNLSGELSKLIIDNKNLDHFSSSINVVQNCSQSDESFILIDSSLVEFVDLDELNFGKLKINANYNLKDQIPIVYLNTQKLSFFTNNGTSNVQLNCLNKTATIKNLGSGNIFIQDKELDFVSLINGSSGNMDLSYSKTSSVSNFGSGVITISNQVKITNTKNTGSGDIKIL